MSSANKRKGTQWEVDLRNYLRGDGFDVERLALSGAQDEGDLVLKLGMDWSETFIIEAKNEQRLNLAGWVGEASIEAHNYATHRGIESPHYVVVHKRRSFNAANAYVTMPLHEWLRQISA